MLTPFMVIISNSLVLVSLVELSTKKSCDGRKNQTNESDKTENTNFLILLNSKSYKSAYLNNYIISL